MDDDDIDIVVGTHRPKIAFLLFLIVAGVTAAVIHKMIPRGTGNDEEAHKVLIVQEYSGGLAAYLSGFGFDAVTGSHGAWKNKVPEEMPELAGQEINLAEILAFADRYGYGFVAIESPERFNFSALDVEPAPTFDSHTRFAVLTTGDFAFPHVFSKNPEPSEVMGSRGLDLMRALFEQPQLAETLSPKDASMDAIKLRSLISPAIDEVLQLAELEKQVETILLETSDELRAPVAGGKGDIHLADKVSEGSSIIPLADGRAITVSQEVSLTSDNGIRLDLEVSRDWKLRALSPTAPLAAEERVACETLLGGTVDRSERLGSQGAHDGRTVLIRTVSSGTQLFAFDTGSGPCGLKPLGKLELSNDFSGRAAVGHDKVAVKWREDGRAQIEVVDTGTLHLRLGNFPSRGTKSLTWLDDRHLAIVTFDERPGVSLALLSLDRPDLVLDLHVPDRSEFYEVRPLLRNGHASLVVRTREGRTNRIERLDFNHGWAELFEQSELAITQQEGTADADDTVGDSGTPGPTILALDPIEEVVPTTVVEVESGMKPFDLSPHGDWVAYTSFAEGGKEVHLVRVPETGASPSAPITLTSDDFYDRDVRFSLDGKRLFWRTEHELGGVNGTLYSLRAVELSTLVGK
jgi:hypothetical protein